MMNRDRQKYDASRQKNIMMKVSKCVSKGKFDSMRVWRKNINFHLLPHQAQQCPYFSPYADYEIFPLGPRMSLAGSWAMIAVEEVDQFIVQLISNQPLSISGVEIQNDEVCLHFSELVKLTSINH